MMTETEIRMAVNQVKIHIERTGEPYDRLYSGAVRHVAYSYTGMVLVEIYSTDKVAREQLFTKIIELAQK
jgi:hypothetical protein